MGTLRRHHDRTRDLLGPRDVDGDAMNMNQRHRHDSILKQLNDDRALSEKQRAVAKKIQRELDDGRIGL